MLIKKCPRHEVQDIRLWSKWQLHETLSSGIRRKIPISSYFSKTSPNMPSFAYFTLVFTWHNVAAKYAKGRLNSGRGAWKLSSLSCSEAAASQGPSITILMEFFPLYAMHCSYNFQIDLAKDNSLFWSYPGLCHRSADLCSYLQVHAIKKPENKVEGLSESIKILIIRTRVWALCYWWQVRSNCSSPEAQITLQVSNRKWTNLALLLFPLPFSSPLLQSRGWFAATQNEKTVVRNKCTYFFMRVLILTPVLWSNLHGLVMCLKTPRLIYPIFFCWLSKAYCSHLCAESFADTAREFQLSAWSLMTEAKMHEKLYIFPSPSVD